jgi:hypothetical protein
LLTQLGAEALTLPHRKPTLEQDGADLIVPVHCLTRLHACSAAARNVLAIALANKLAHRLEF